MAISALLTLKIIIVGFSKINYKQWQNKLDVLHTGSEVCVLTVIRETFCSVYHLKYSADIITSTNTKTADNC